MSDGRIVIDTEIDNRGIEKGVNSLGGVASKGLKVFSATIVGSGVALGGLGIACTKLASDLGEVQNVVDTTFGTDSAVIGEWAKDAAEKVGVGELAYKKFTGTMGAMLKSMGLTGDEVLIMSGNIGDLAGDMASFYNLDPQEAFEKIRSGISGETEPLKQLGINMSVANLEAFALTQGITKQYKEMNQAEQATLRYNYLMKATADSQGDFAKTSDSLANQMRVASLNVKSLCADIGTLLLPVAQDAMKSFNGITNKLREALSNPETQESIKKLATAIGELVTGALKFLVDHLDDVIKGLTWVIDNSNSIAAGIIAIAAAMGVLKIEMIVASLITAYTKAVTAASLAGKALTVTQWLLNTALAPIGGVIGLVVIAIVALVAAFVYLWNTSEGFRNFWTEMWEKIKTAASDAWDRIVNIFNTVIDFVKNNWKQLLLFIVNPFAGAFALLYKNCEGFRNFIDGFIETVKQKFFDGINAIVNFFTVTIPNLVTSITNWFGQLPANIGYILGYLLGTFVRGLTMIWDIITITIPALITSIATWFSELPGKIWTWLVQTVIDIGIWGLNIYNSAKEWIGNTVESIANYFSELPGRIWEWLSSTIINILKWAYDMREKSKQAAADTVDGILNWFATLPQSMLEIGTNLVKGIWDGIVGAKDWLFGKIGAFCDGVISGFMGGFDEHSPSRIMRDLVGVNLVKGIGVGIDIESPNLDRDILAYTSSLSAKMKGTVDHNIASTTAGVVAQNNYKIASQNTQIVDTSGLDSVANLLKGLVNRPIQNNIEIDGREVLKATAPYQDEWENWRDGR